MADLLTLDELAEQSGVPLASLQNWQTWGLIGRGDAEAFTPEDVRRARLIGLLLRRGVAVDALAEAERSEGFLGHYLDLLPEQSGPRYSVKDAAERIGLDVGMLQRFASAAALGEDSLSDEDVGLLRGMKIILDSGLPEEALVQLLRVYAEALGRVADAEARLFHFYVHERLRAEGMPDSELAAVTEAARRRMMPLVEPTILYFTAWASPAPWKRTRSCTCRRTPAWSFRPAPGRRGVCRSGELHATRRHDGRRDRGPRALAVRADRPRCCGRVRGPSGQADRRCLLARVP